VLFVHFAHTWLRYIQAAVLTHSHKVTKSRCTTCCPTDLQQMNVAEHGSDEKLVAVVGGRPEGRTRVVRLLQLQRLRQRIGVCASGEISFVRRAVWPGWPVCRPVSVHSHRSCDETPPCSAAVPHRCDCVVARPPRSIATLHHTPSLSSPINLFSSAVLSVVRRIYTSCRCPHAAKFGPSSSRRSFALKD